MSRTIKAWVQRDNGWYVAQCAEIAVVTQGRTLDECIDNLQEAVALHLEGENLDDFGLAPDPAILVMFETEPTHAQVA